MTRGMRTWSSTDQAAGAHMLRSEFMTAITSRLAVDRTKGIVAAGTSSGRVHLWTGPADPKETVGDEPIKASSDHGCSVQ